MDVGSMTVIFWALVHLHHVSPRLAEGLAARLGYACQMAQVARDGDDPRQLDAVAAAAKDTMKKVKGVRKLELGDFCDVSDFHH